MANNFRSFSNGIRVEPQNATAPSLAGELRYNSASNTFEVYDTALRTVANLDGTQTLSNKTLTTPAIDVPLFSQSATPANPTSSKNKLYFKSDDKLYSLNSAGVESVLSGYAFTPVPNTRLISTTSPLTGGGDLTADRTIAIPVSTSSVNGYLSSTDWTTFNNKVGLGAVQSKTGNYTALTTDSLIKCDSSGGTFTITLYAASSNTGRILNIIKTDTSFTAITIDGNASETINGSLTTTLNTQYEELTLYCDGSNWSILNRRIPSIPTAYNPTPKWLQATVTNPDLGAGGYTAYWQRIGGSIRIYGQCRFGSGSTYGAGNWGVALPDNLTCGSTYPSPNNYVPSIGSGVAVQEAGATRQISVSGSNGNYFIPLYWTSDTVKPTIISPTSPWTWASNDTLSIDFILPVTGWNS